MQRFAFKGAVLLVAAVALGVVLYVKNAPESNKLAVTEGENIDFYQDSDGDGLPDWEEPLWGTNPSDPDTDGDGTLDGTEAFSGRDPLIIGPNDTRTREIKSIEESGLAEPLAETVKEELVAAFAAQSSEYLFTDHYTKEHLVIISDSEETRRAYREHVIEVLRELENVEGNELVILDEALSGNEEALGKLDPMIEIYRSVLSELLLTPTPKSASDLHLAFVNKVRSYTDTVQYMRWINQNPLLAITSINNYLAVEEETQAAFDELNLFLSVVE